MPMLNSLMLRRLSLVSWVPTTPSDHSKTDSWVSRVHMRNIRIEESKPTSIPPVPLSSTSGNRAITMISGTVTSSNPPSGKCGGPISSTTTTTHASPATTTARSKSRLGSGWPVGAAAEGGRGRP
jgi:hypothetical protein